MDERMNESSSAMANGGGSPACLGQEDTHKSRLQEVARPSRIPDRSKNF